MGTTDFYEDDEEVMDVRAAFEAGDILVTGRQVIAITPVQVNGGGMVPVWHSLTTLRGENFTPRSLASVLL